MSSRINPDRVRLSGDQLVPVKGKVNTGVRRRMTVRFLKGPVPLGWLAAATCLPGKALHVAVILRFLSGLNRSSRVRFSQSIARDFGVDRPSVYRALIRLEKAGLITVERHPGRNSIVTILEADLEYLVSGENKGRAGDEGNPDG